MTWFKVDDGFWRHRKVRLLGSDKAAAVGVWMLAGSHAAEELSDGFVPHEVLRQWDPDGAMTNRLIEVGLWAATHVMGEDGVQFHDWLDYNPSREKVLADRAREAEKKAKARAALAERRHQSRSARPGGTPQVTPTGSAALPEPVPGSPPSSGNPGPAGRDAERPPVPDAVREARERYQRQPSTDGLAVARAALDALVPRSKRPATDRRGRRRGSSGQIPMVASVRPDPAAVERAEQDRLAELEVTQAPAPGTARASPAASASALDDLPDQQEQAS